MLANSPSPAPIFYPESDGLPMADNSKQMDWIVILFNNLRGLFQSRQDVFVGSNQFWYPVEGHPEEVTAPDVYVVFGRPKGDRPSYKQWEENNIPMTVIFEILSPGNSDAEMDNKQLFYEQHGVEEYYVYDPDNNQLKVYIRNGSVLLRERKVNGFASPRLGIRFDLSGPDMVVYRPNNQPFITFEEMEIARDVGNLRADQEKQRAEDEKVRADKAEQQSSRLAELSRKARRGQASVEELQELERLEEQRLPPSP
jgi:Uma2 family endonuclease